MNENLSLSYTVNRSLNSFTLGLVYADKELISSADVAMAQRSMIGEDEIRSMRLNVLVASGAYMLAINETIQSQLELPSGRGERCSSPVAG